MSAHRGLPVFLFALLIPIGCGKTSEPLVIPTPPAALRVPELPPVPPLPEWPADPPTADKIALGTKIFFDVRLSGHGKINCDACHGHNVNFQDNLRGGVPDRSYPSDRPVLPRNSTSLYNLVYAPVFRWDGSHTDLVEVMAFPFSEANMNLGTDVPSAQVGLKQKLTTEVPGYVAEFRAVFGADIKALPVEEVWRLTGRALAAFVRLAVSRDAAFDRWNAGDDQAMTASAVRGLQIFRTRGRCIACHSGPFFTDFGYHNLSTALPDKDGNRPDEGRALISGKEADRGAFLTPTLRGTYDSAPYFHDGSGASLRHVLRHFSSAAVHADPNHDPLFGTTIPLSDDDIDDLVEFMGALRGQPVTGIEPPTTFP